MRWSCPFEIIARISKTYKKLQHLYENLCVFGLAGLLLLDETQWNLHFRVRDSDPLGPRLAAVLCYGSWERGSVARATRVCRRCARVALQYSPTRTECGERPKNMMLQTKMSCANFKMFFFVYLQFWKIKFCLEKPRGSNFSPWGSGRNGLGFCRCSQKRRCWGSST